MNTVSSIVGFLGMIVGLAALAMLVARPQIISAFFSGSSQLINAATAPAR